MYNCTKCKFKYHFPLAKAKTRIMAAALFFNIKYRYLSGT